MVFVGKLVEKSAEKSVTIYIPFDLAIKEYGDSTFSMKRIKAGDLCFFIAQRSQHQHRNIACSTDFTENL